jgi:hypothetical protein
VNIFSTCFYRASKFCLLLHFYPKFLFLNLFDLFFWLKIRFQNKKTFFVCLCVVSCVSNNGVKVWWLCYASWFHSLNNNKKLCFHIALNTISHYQKN